MYFIYTNIYIGTDH